MDFNETTLLNTFDKTTTFPERDLRRYISSKVSTGIARAHEKAADHARARISVATVSLKAAARRELCRRTSIKGKGETATISSPSW